MIAIAVVGVLLVLFWAWRGVLLPFIIGLVLAYLMLPGIYWLEKRLPPRHKWPRFKRIVSILIVFLVTLGVLALLTSFIVITVFQAFSDLFARAPDFINEVMTRIQEWANNFQQQLPPGLQTQVQQYITNLGLQLEGIVQNIAQRGFSFISGTFGALLGFAALPLFLFYFLKDFESLRNGFYSFIPDWARQHSKNIIHIVEQVLGRYIRATIVLGIIVATLSLIGLSIMGVPYAPALAFFAGVTEMLPTIGPWIGGGLAALVTLSTAPEKVILVVLLFIGVQLVENNLLVPRVQGGYLRINPAIALFLLVIGAYIAGIWGIILAVPIGATLARITAYVKDIQSDSKVTEELPVEERDELTVD